MSTKEELSKDYLHGMLDSMDKPAILLNRQYEIVMANQQYCDHYGTDEAIEGRHCYEVSHHYQVPCDQAGETCPLKDSLATCEPQRSLHLHHTPRGEEHVDVEIKPLFNQQGEIEYLVECMTGSDLASASSGDNTLVGRSPAFNNMLELIQRVAPRDTTVLLLGETGTGKELIAHAIHENSERHSEAFVPVECSGLTETLFESELFGHEKGSFTGATQRKIGLIEAARDGTLFLDEVGDIPMGMQVKLLRLLETNTYRRVGSTEPQAADFRLVCATHRDLAEMVKEGSFREDFYYRINTFPVHLPALRERQEDLQLLIDTLLERITGKQKLSVSNPAFACLASYRFPGNIRELRNILERASIMADGNTILPEHLPEHCRCQAGQITNEPTDVITLEQAEHRYLRQVIARFSGDKQELARKLGISERTLYRKLNELDN